MRRMDLGSGVALWLYDSRRTVAHDHPHFLCESRTVTCLPPLGTHLGWLISAALAGAHFTFGSRGCRACLQIVRPHHGGTKKTAGVRVFGWNPHHRTPAVCVLGY